MANEAIVDEVPFFEIYLKSTNGSGLEPQVSLEVLSNLPDQPLEGQLADEQLGGLLVPPDLPEGNGTGPVTMGLLDSSRGWRRLPGSLGGQLLPWGLASGGLTSGLLGTCHCECRGELNKWRAALPGQNNRSSFGTAPPGGRHREVKKQRRIQFQEKRRCMNQGSSASFAQKRQN